MKPTSTPVSREAMQSISDAISTIAGDPTLKRTKRQVEHLSALSHATVARAFTQDANEPSAWGLNARFLKLVEVTGPRTVDEIKRAHLQTKLDEKTRTIRELRDQRVNHMQALYAYYLSTTGIRTDEASVSSIRRSRTHRG